MKDAEVFRNGEKGAGEWNRAEIFAG